MESKILFLGTGSGNVANQQIRGSGGILIISDGYQFLLDPGPGSLVRARQIGVNIQATTAVLVSHAHIHHCNDTNIILQAMSYGGIDPKGVLIANKTFAEGDETTPAQLLPFHRKCVERVIIPEPGQKIGIEHLEVHALKTQHSDPHALGFKLFTPGFVLSYTGDTGYTKELAQQYEQSDILIINMPYVDKKDSNNMNKEDVTKLIKQIQPRLAILTHFGTKVLKEDPLQIAREIQLETEVQTVAAKDGLLISPGSYAAGLRHKTLNLFPGETTKVQEHTQQDNQQANMGLPGNNEQTFL